GRRVDAKPKTSSNRDVIFIANVSLSLGRVCDVSRWQRVWHSSAAQRLPQPRGRTLEECRASGGRLPRQTESDIHRHVDGSRARNGPDPYLCPLDSAFPENEANRAIAPGTAAHYHELLQAEQRADVCSGRRGDYNGVPRSDRVPGVTSRRG